MIRYKLIDSKYRTRAGYKNCMFWRPGETNHVLRGTPMFCSNKVIHWYDTQELAGLLDSLHNVAHYERCIQIEVDKVILHDGLKGGSVSAKMIKEVDRFSFSIEQKNKFTILCLMKLYNDEKFLTWAKNWLDGSDRSEKLMLFYLNTINPKFSGISVYLKNSILYESSLDYHNIDSYASLAAGNAANALVNYKRVDLQPLALAAILG